MASSLFKKKEFCGHMGLSIIKSPHCDYKIWNNPLCPTCVGNDEMKRTFCGKLSKIIRPISVNKSRIVCPIRNKIVTNEPLFWNRDFGFLVSQKGMEMICKEKADVWKKNRCERVYLL